MSVNFTDLALPLQKLGYYVHPLKPRAKAPAVGGWVKPRLYTQALADKYKANGVGVLCGRGANPITAVDIDTLDADVANQFVQWCYHNIGFTITRIGRAPKTLLVYRAEQQGLLKLTGASFTDAAERSHRVEILGAGQQFAAYGIHPDTGEPYTWVDLLGGLQSQAALSLPLLTAANAQAALIAFEAIAERAGLVRVSPREGIGAVPRGAVDPLESVTTACGLDLVEAQTLLAEIPADKYDVWLTAGMALHHEFDGDERAFAIWLDWSSTAPEKFAGVDDCGKRWASFGKRDGEPITCRWLIKVSRAHAKARMKADKRFALDAALKKIADCTDSIDLLNDVAQEVNKVVEGDVGMLAEAVSAIRDRFKVITGGTLLTATDAKKAMRGKPTKQLGTAFDVKSGMRYPLSELGNAQRFAARHGIDTRYVPQMDSWIIWSGSFWRTTHIVQMERLMKDSVATILEDYKEAEAQDSVTRWHFFCQQMRVITNSIRHARSERGVTLDADQLDKLTSLLGCANGAVDLTTGLMVEPKREHYITRTTDVAYDPDARCPLFIQTLADCFFGDMEMVEFMQRLLGYTVLGGVQENLFVIPYGYGSNGKSTIFNTIRRALGEHARMAKAETFTGSAIKDSSNAREDLMDLRGRRFIYVTEPEESNVLKEAFVKGITGGEPIPARGLYGRMINIDATWTVYMPTNHKPIIRGEDYGIWRRLVPIPFTRNFDTDKEVKKDPLRYVKLGAELPGVLAWIVAGALKYQKGGLCMPNSIKEARNAYRSDMDFLTDWLNDCCELGADYSETVADLWRCWSSYAHANGLQRYIQSSQSLSQRLQGRGFSVGKYAHQRVMRGLQVKLASM